MQTLTFSCPHCTNLMAVGLELLGQQVQCPTCGQVIIAPVSVPDSQAAPVASASQGSSAVISFDQPKQEPHDSIFGEVQDEDVFGSRLPKVEIPEGPPITPVPSAMNKPSNFASFAPGMPPTANGSVEASAPQTPILEVPPAAPVAAVAPVPAPMSWTNSEPPAEPQATPVAPAASEWQPAAPGSEWRAADAASEPTYAADAHIEAPQIRRPTPSREQRRLSSLMLAILGPYSVVVTMFCGYYIVKYRNAAEGEHPFANIPDLRGCFDPAIRKQFATTLPKMPNPDADMPDKLKVNLKDTLRIGQLEVTPERVEQGKIKERTVMQSNQVNVQQLGGEALILHLRIKNVSSDVEVCPTDPFFDRLYSRNQGSAKPYFLLEIHRTKYYGGPIDFLAIDWKQVKRKYIEGQENDDAPLKPGEERSTIVCSDPRDQAANQALKECKPNDALMWRVQLRHGLIEFHGKEYSVTGLIGVQFTAGDIKKRN
jgi:hypothetical protein